MPFPLFFWSTAVPPAGPLSDTSGGKRRVALLERGQRLVRSANLNSEGCFAPAARNHSDIPFTSGDRGGSRERRPILHSDQGARAPEDAGASGRAGHCADDIRKYELVFACSIA
jgi:hypothetical protein